MESMANQHVPFTVELDNALAQELSKLLSSDTDHKGNATFMSEVWLATLEGASPQEIAEAHGHKNTVATKTFINAIRMILGDLSIDPKLHNSIKHVNLRRQKWLQLELSPQARAHLLALDLDTPILTSPSEPTPINESPVAITGPGIYVYSYPHLLHTAKFANTHPLVKIGASGVGVAQRVARQASQTEVPEELILLGAWTCDEPFLVEAKIHRVLKAAGLHRSTSKTGKEWFQASVELVESIAEALELKRIG